MFAQPNYDLILIHSHTQLEGVGYIEVGCRDYDHYQLLPPAVKFDGSDFGLTGWNSDRCVAYYRTDALMARVI